MNYFHEYYTAQLSKHTPFIFNGNIVYEDGLGLTGGADSIVRGCEEGNI